MAIENIHGRRYSTDTLLGESPLAPVQKLLAEGKHMLGKAVGSLSVVQIYRDGARGGRQSALFGDTTDIIINYQSEEPLPPPLSSQPDREAQGTLLERRAGEIIRRTTTEYMTGVRSITTPFEELIVALYKNNGSIPLTSLEVPAREIQGLIQIKDGIVSFVKEA